MKYDLQLNFKFKKISSQLFDIWFCKFSQTEISNSDLSILNEDEKIKASRFATTKLKSQSLQSKIFVRKILSNYTSIRPENLVFYFGKYGKPALKVENLAQNIYFNISHTNSLFCLAVSMENEVGIDIEKKDFGKPDESLWRHICTEPEINYLKSLSPMLQKTEFLKIWTRKEAILKAEGFGFAKNPREVEVYNCGIKTIYATWQVFSFLAPEDHQASLAICLQNKNETHIKNNQVKV